MREAHGGRVGRKAKKGREGGRQIDRQGEGGKEVDVTGVVEPGEFGGGQMNKGACFVRQSCTP